MAFAVNLIVLPNSTADDEALALTDNLLPVLTSIALLLTTLPVLSLTSTKNSRSPSDFAFQV